MELSDMENQQNQSLRSPPKRRRSTFFERHDSIVPQISKKDENIDPNECKRLDDMDSEINQNLLRYHEKLLVEKKQWKTEVNERQNKYHDIKQQFQLAINAPTRSLMSYSLLSAEDIEFLNGRVNISNLVEDQLKLHESIKKTQELYRKAMKLDDMLLSCCEERVSEVTDYVLENSIIE